jgi:hypothetical protein
MGPLYHLLDRDDRVQAWREARRVVKPDGLVIAATINRFASLFAGLGDGLLVTEFRNIVDGDLRNGEHRNPYGNPHPDEIERELTDAGASVARAVETEPSLRGLSAHLLVIARRPPL